MTSRVRVFSQQAGFTLLELIIAVGIFSIVLTAVYGLFNANLKTYASQEITMETTQDIRGVIALMVNEIRMAGCDPTDAGGIGFIQDLGNSDYNTDGDSIHFTMDITDTLGTSPPGPPDGFVTGPDEDINYYLFTDTDGIQKLARRAGGTTLLTTPAANYITNLSFTYFNAAGTQLFPPLSLANISNIRTVGISITARTRKADPALGRFKSFTQTTRVRIRNAGL
jgi:type IV pilus assembly protein PilW